MSTTILAIPPLWPGDRLSDDEYMRRYEEMPGVKAELLDGEVYIAPPVKFTHGQRHAELVGFIVYYSAFTPGIEASDNGTILMSEGNIPQPDVHLRILESLGGQCFINEDHFVAGAPELVGEVTLSSVDYDHAIKQPIFQKCGVREYILWRVEEKAIDWLVLRNGVYQELQAGSDGIIRSETFPGLWLDVHSMIQDDARSVLEAVRKGLASPEHAAFVAELQQRQQSKS